MDELGKFEFAKGSVKDENPISGSMKEEEEDYEEIGDGNVYSFMETVLVEGKQENQGEELCDLFNFSSDIENNIGPHKKSANQRKKHKCEKCDHVAQTPSHLKLHIESVHLGIRYQCNKIRME